MRFVILLLVLGCGATLTDGDSALPQVGRYDYQLDHEGTHLSADFVILDASATSLRYRFYIQADGGQNQPTTVQHNGTGVTVNAWFPSRVSANLLVREGNAYRCTATVLRLTIRSPGTCSLTFEGPDSVRTAP